MNETFETIKNLSLTAQTIALQAIDKAKNTHYHQYQFQKKRLMKKKREKFKIKVLFARFSLSVTDEQVK